MTFLLALRAYVKAYAYASHMVCAWLCIRLLAAPSLPSSELATNYFACSKSEYAVLPAAPLVAAAGAARLLFHPHVQ